jgi:hypothetical protein
LRRASAAYVSGPLAGAGIAAPLRAFFAEVVA